jgi:hypothetical protein
MQSQCSEWRQQQEQQQSGVRFAVATSSGSCMAANSMETWWFPAGSLSLAILCSCKDFAADDSKCVVAQVQLVGVAGTEADNLPLQTLLALAPQPYIAHAAGLALKQCNAARCMLLCSEHEACDAS